MKWKATVVIISETNPHSRPLVLTNADVKMTYDYPDHIPSDTVIPQIVHVAWRQPWAMEDEQ